MSENYNTNNPLKTDPSRVIEVKILNSLNGGAGGGGGAPSYINYAGPPVTNPPALSNIVVDSNGRQWQYFQSAWH